MGGVGRQCSMSIQSSPRPWRPVRVRAPLWPSTADSGASGNRHPSPAVPSLWHRLAQGYRPPRPPTPTTANRPHVFWNEAQHQQFAVDRDPAEFPFIRQDGKPDRLNPRWVEWLMGLQEGWATGVPGISRRMAMKMLGNGVVPPQGVAALRLLLLVIVCLASEQAARRKGAGSPLWDGWVRRVPKLQHGLPKGDHACQDTASVRSPGAPPAGPWGGHRFLRTWPKMTALTECAVRHIGESGPLWKIRPGLRDRTSEPHRTGSRWFAPISAVASGNSRDRLRVCRTCQGPSSRWRRWRGSSTSVAWCVRRVRTLSGMRIGRGSGGLSGRWR